MFDFSVEYVLSLLYALPGVLLALSVHEFSHGYVASKFGDPTAKLSGRLTLNPIKHIDIFGFISMLIVGFGWAKPVPVNTRYLKKARRDMAFIALAGPVSNLITAFLGTVLYYLFVTAVFKLNINIPVEIFNGIILIIISLISVNVGLAIFNLIPIPPLDGSRILDAFLPTKAYIAYHKYEQIITIVLFVLIITDIIPIPISGAIDWVMNGMLKIVGLVF